MLIRFDHSERIRNAKQRAVGLFLWYQSRSTTQWGGTPAWASNFGTPYPRLHLLPYCDQTWHNDPSTEEVCFCGGTCPATLGGGLLFPQLFGNQIYANMSWRRATRFCLVTELGEGNTWCCPSLTVGGGRRSINILATSAYARTVWPRRMLTLDLFAAANLLVNPDLRCFSLLLFSTSYYDICRCIAI